MTRNLENLERRSNQEWHQKGGEEGREKAAPRRQPRKAAGRDGFDQNVSTATLNWRTQISEASSPKERRVLQAKLVVPLYLTRSRPSCLIQEFPSRFDSS